MAGHNYKKHSLSTASLLCHRRINFNLTLIRCSNKIFFRARRRNSAEN